MGQMHLSETSTATAHRVDQFSCLHFSHLVGQSGTCNQNFCYDFIFKFILYKKNTFIE